MRRRCPTCGTRLTYGIRWSKSKKRLRIVYKCNCCFIWGYSEDF